MKVNRSWPVGTVWLNTHGDPVLRRGPFEPTAAEPPCAIDLGSPHV